jgi:hypothetical protein
MDKDYQNLFSYLKLLEAPDYLADNIILKMRIRQRVATNRRICFFSISTAFSIIALFFGFRSMQVNLINSGFWNFFSLIFSDFKIVVAYGWNFVLTLLETLPVVNLIILFVIVFLFLESIKFLAKNIKNIKIINLSKYYGYE